MFIGAVKWFDNTKGFGLLSLPGGGSLFFHKSAFEGKFHGLTPGNVVIGTKKPSTNRKGMEARNCRLASSPTDWPLLLDLLEGPDDVEVQDAGDRPRYKKGKPRKQGLLRLGIDQYCSRIEASRLLPMATEGLPAIVKKPEAFLRYAAVLEGAVLRNFGNETAMALLGKIFAAFGNLATPDILFAVWKTGNFKYIGYPRHGDYEIPEELLRLHLHELGYKELCRIKAYSFGVDFCREVALARLSDPEGHAQSAPDERSP